MKAEVLICLPDGTQTIELCEFPDNWFDPLPEKPETDKAE